MTERQVQRQVVEGLRARGAEVIVTHDAKRKPATVGVTDLIVALPGGRTIYVECKGEYGSASEEQMAFAARLRALAHTVVVVRGWDDLERFL